MIIVENIKHIIVGVGMHLLNCGIRVISCARRFPCGAAGQTLLELIPGFGVNGLFVQVIPHTTEPRHKTAKLLNVFKHLVNNLFMPFSVSCKQVLLTMRNVKCLLLFCFLGIGGSASLHQICHTGNHFGGCSLYSMFVHMNDQTTVTVNILFLSSVM